MSEILQKVSNTFNEKFVKPTEAKFSGFITKHPEIFCLSLLAVLCLLFLFLGLDFYPLLDVDETRYAVMARDMVNSFNWNNMMFNMEPFLEKPPLYFWLVGASVKMLGHFSELAVRLPIALSATFLTFSTYFFGKKIISRKFGMISALVLLSSVFFLIFSHIAILDMVLTVFMTSALYCGFLTHFCQEKFKKYLWWYFYLFIGVGFLAKGLLALAIPFTIIFVYNMFTKTLKDLFKPLNILPGILIFLAIVTPWHLIMYLEYGNRFIKEYFLLHHFARFIDSANIGRERPLLYFVPIFLMGFLPWTLVFLAFTGDCVKKLVAKFEFIEGTLWSKLRHITDVQNNEQKLLLFGWLYFIIVFLVFSLSSTKLPTYILPVFPAASLLTGYFWWLSDEKKQSQKTIYITTEIFAGVCILIATAASIAFWFLAPDIQNKVADFRQGTICGLYLLSILMLLRLDTKKTLSIFASYIFMMLFIISLGVSHIFNVVYTGGENEIVKYSAHAQGRSAQLVTFDFAVKPSAKLKYSRKVHFLTDPDFEKLDEVLKYKIGPTFVIVKNVNMEDQFYNDKVFKRLSLVASGDRYSLFVKEVKYKPQRTRKIGMPPMGIMPH